MGEVAVITGGAGGIAFGIASALVRAGYDVALWDTRGDLAKASADRLAAAGARSMGRQCDVTSVDGVKAATRATVDALGPPNLLVNNAGITRSGHLETMALADWQLVIDVNLTGTFVCTQVVGRHLLDSGRASIVNVASISGLVPSPFRAAYNASKAAIVALTQTVALEWGPRGVRCNAISPGPVRTAMTESAYQSPELFEERRLHVPLKRLGLPDEMGAAVVYLASEGASFINGANLVVDGGLSINGFGGVPILGPSDQVVRPDELYVEPSWTPSDEE